MTVTEIVSVNQPPEDNINDRADQDGGGHKQGICLACWSATAHGIGIGRHFRPDELEVIPEPA